MGLSCSCYHDGSYEWYYWAPEDFTTLKTARRKRCLSCGELINVGATCVAINRFRDPSNEIEERIHGMEVPLADKHMCEKCGEIFLNLIHHGYCVTMDGHTMQEELETHWAATGFKPQN